MAAGDVNRHFKRPPTVALTSSEALAGLECNASSRFWISTVDVRDAFHRIAVPNDLSDCFAVPAGPVREFKNASLMVRRSTVTITCGHVLSGSASHDAAVVEAIGATATSVSLARILGKWTCSWVASVASFTPAAC